MGIRNPNSTSYVHPDEPNLLNLHKAMTYADGEPHLRVTLGSDNITITGSVNVATDIRVNNQPSDPVPVQIQNGSLNVNVLGEVLVQLDSQSVISVNGTVFAEQTGSWNVGITGTPTVNIGTIPEVEIKNDSGNPIPITGSVVVDNDSSNPLEVNAIISNPDPINVNANITGGTVTVQQAAGDFTYVKYIDETNTQMDSVGRLRVSPPVQSYWYTPTVDKDGDLRFQEKFVGTGARSDFVQNISGIRITSGTDSNGSAIRVSRRRHKMRPNVSVMWSGTNNFNGVQPNVTKRRGFFTQYNGIYWEVTDDLYLCIRRRLIDGTLVEERIARSDFTFDKLDGTNNATNPSGLNLNPTTSAVTFGITGYTSKTATVISATETHYNLVFTTTGTAPFRLGTKVNVSGASTALYNSIAMVIAVSAGSITLSYPSDPGSWTGTTATMTQTGLHFTYTWWVDFIGDRTTRIRCGIHTAEGPHVLHIIDRTGLEGTQIMNAPAMPDRTEIFNTGAVSVLPNMTIGSTSITVEAEVELNPGFGVAANNTGVTFDKQQTQEYAILGLGLRAGEPYQRSDIQLQGVQLTDIGNTNPQNSGAFYWRLLLNPTLGGDFTEPGTATEVLCGKSSRFWRFTTSTTFTGGIELWSGYATQSTIIDIRTALNFLNMGSNTDNTDADKIVLVVKHLAGGVSNPIIVAGFNFIEAL